MHKRTRASSAAIGLGMVTLMACASRPVAPNDSSRAGTAAPVTLTYLGVAGWQLGSADAALIVDPYFSRIAVSDDQEPLISDDEAIAQYAPRRADAILVGHSHYDHLLDVPAIAKKTGAAVVGPESVMNVVRAAGVGEQKLVPVHVGSSLTMGPFVISAVHGLHAETGEAHASIPRDILLPMAAKAYAADETIHYFVRVQGQSVLFIGSANYDEHAFEGLRPDVAVVATALREKVPNYSCRLMRVLGQPRLVLANHFDAHWEELGPQQNDVGDELRASLERFEGEIHACSPTTKVVVPEHFRPIPL
jgi:L-ascorbate metabolism protein UlaG (beta-lactamase superfamily)